jgi:hypothetical protein
MRRSSFVLFAASLGAVTLVAGSAFADGPCGTFDLSGSLDCKIKVSADCSASCGVDKLEASCSGHCTAAADTKCTKDDCGATCIAQCDPSLLDCFSGCHAECDQPAIDLCNQKHPGEDCVSQGKAQCDIHCKDNCKVPDTNCEEHCNKCCLGSCQVQANFDCDFSCTADVKAHCSAHCSKPEGGIFCNGQFVDATDVQQCVSYLATKGINVDVSAQGSANCGPNGCGADASAKAAGCAAAPGSDNGVAGAFALIGVATAFGAWKRRRRR